MNWLKKKIRDWLGITQLQSEYNLLDKKYDKLYEEYRALSETHAVLLDKYTSLNRGVETLTFQNSRLESRNKELSERIEFILKNFKIAVDHYPRGNESWAVVCVEGKPEYVRLINLSRADVREIAYYLKQFDRDSRIVDSPVAFLKTDFFKL